MEKVRTRGKGPLRPTPFTFDVTCVIGTVEVGATGDHAPHVVAMQLIAEHDAQGTFTFPMPDGRTQRVTVEWVGDDPREEPFPLDS